MPIRSRQQRLLKHVNAVGVASVQDLSRLYDVSEMTIRRDIDHLSRSRLLAKVKGGAQRLEESAKFHEAHLRARMKLNIAAKQRLAEKAATLVEHGDTLFLDGSTTIICLAEVLARLAKEITVITNSVLVALELAEARNIRLVSLGGLFDYETFSFSPMDEDDALKGYHVKKAFLSCTGLILAKGTYENAVFNMAVKRKAARSAKTVCLLVDAGKLEQRAFSLVLDIDEIDELVTEDVLTREQLDFLAGKNIRTYLVRSQT
ncbi:MAG: DeoR/GlpR family DNA-binding transcription regulator [Planctomycetota bacterium]|nr:DeoR/GlpR family DNA-binding transcription regulator [Planctomycetota bacterium]